LGVVFAVKPCTVTFELETPITPAPLGRHANFDETLRRQSFIGCGAHALTTVPLAYLVGETGRIVSIDRSRWRFFEEVTSSAGVKHRIIPLKLDARELPFPFRAFSLAVLVHGIRSLKNEETITKVISEMLRVSERVFIAESLPVANNERQRAHLELYNLREEIFEALFGERDDFHYLTLERLKELVERAGGKVIESGTFEPKLPHYLAYIPREYVEGIEDEEKRAKLLRRWDRAYEKWKNGAEHPPVGWLVARLSRAFSQRQPRLERG